MTPKFCDIKGLGIGVNQVRKSSSTSVRPENVPPDLFAKALNLRVFRVIRRSIKNPCRNIKRL